MRRPIVSVASPTRLPKHTPPGTGGGVHHLPSQDGRPAAICDARSTEDAASTLAGLLMAVGVSSNAVVAPNAAAPPGQVILVCHPGYQSYITGYQSWNGCSSWLSNMRIRCYQSYITSSWLYLSVLYVIQAISPGMVVAHGCSSWL
jgi:hypothetical protein